MCGMRLASHPGIVAEPFDITYAAHTASCTFLLDAEGICRRIVLASSSKRSAASRANEAARAASGARAAARRCVGAQYVASLDASVSGLLAERPRVGAAMLFARVDERGRASLVRTGTVTRFETLRAEDPFEQDATPSTSVETSAPTISPSARTPRRTPVFTEDPYEDDAIEPTQPIHALRPGDLFLARRRGDESLARTKSDESLARTSQYESSGAEGRPTWPSAGVVRDALPAPTLRQPPALSPPPSEEDGAPFAASARAVVPRRTDPVTARARARIAEPSRSRGMLPLEERMPARQRGGR